MAAHASRALGFKCLCLAFRNDWIASDSVRRQHCFSREMANGKYCAMSLIEKRQRAVCSQICQPVRSPPCKPLAGFQTSLTECHAIYIVLIFLWLFCIASGGRRDELHMTHVR